MNIGFKKITLILLCGICIYSAFAIAGEISGTTPESNTSDDLIFPIAPKEGTSTQELQTKSSPIDLRDPENIRSTVEYDPETGHYILHTKMGDEDISSPYVLNSEEFKQYSMQKSMQDYWRQKNAAELRDGKDKFDLTNIQVDIGKGDLIFGPGGIQVKTQGSAELKFGFKKNKVDNPTLTERSRNPPATFDFDEKIQLSVKGTVGDKISLALNYNTEASFDYDQKLIKLAYEGKEDEILQKFEAGNVSMPLSSSLITGSTALFGIKTQLKFGRLTIDGLLSQQESETQTVSLRNGAQTTPFEMSADNYDENRHFFMAHYFYDNYDKAMSTLPYINSSIKINRIEVWVTNKRGNYDQARNIIAFTDLAESNVNNMVQPPLWSSSGKPYPSNDANSLYSTVSAYPEIRNISTVNQALQDNGLEAGEDYEKIESARLLNSSEYTINYELGYVSLKAALNSDEVLGVAYEYTAGGVTYQVGEFSSQVGNSTSNPEVPADQNLKTSPNLIVKLLKGTNLHPQSPTWALMMKNVYSLGAYQLQSDKFELNIMYQSDSAGVYLNYLPNSPIDTIPLLRVMNLDRLDSHNEVRSRGDGFFDYIEGYTVISSTGRIIFPVVEPFGVNLKKKLTVNGNFDPRNNKFIYQELYDSTLVVAQEFSEKNKFKLKGKYKGSSGSEIRLNAMNIPRGSVTVTAGGVKLIENSDYTVDYSMGAVTILNTAYLDSGTPIDVKLENQSYFNTQRKSLMGMHLDYKFNEDFNIGGTIMHLSEKPLTQKVTMGSEPISNTIWGLNTSYKTQSQWLTNMLDKLPLLKLTQPSSIAFNAEFAQLIPGVSKVIENYAYIDDFESTKIGIDLRAPSTWKLASTPADRDNPDLKTIFDQSQLNNNVEYGYNRSLLAWYNISTEFTRKTTGGSSGDLAYIRSDKDQLSNLFVREIQEREVYPNKERIYGQPSTLTVLNLAYYPKERGPYNLNAGQIGSDGKITNPKGNWGGIMRKLETTDFETANIEYIEFWLMDPFVYNNDPDNQQFRSSGGDLYINLGDVSEDILKDGKKFFEHGLPVDGDKTKIDSTAWGYVPKIQSTITAFESTNITAQDLGLNGFTDAKEKIYGDYAVYLQQLKGIISADIQSQMESDPFSLFNDPAGDNYHHYRGSDYTDQRLGVLDRYKRFNGLQGNSTQGKETYSTTSTSLPDVEDINADNTLTETERFYRYKVSLRPQDMQIGSNYIVDIREAEEKLDNNETAKINWYQFKIPVREGVAVNKINNLKSIRFMRMFMTNFEDETHLRFASLQLIRGEWREYKKDLRYDADKIEVSGGSIDVSAVNIEENSNKTPVNYILPPGVSRVIDPSQSQIRQENEQAMLMKIDSLAPKDVLAVYKNSGMDMRQYKKLQMFVHAEAKYPVNTTNLNNYELTAFIRLGSDHTNNFYEYEIPLVLTAPGQYSSKISGEDWKVWPKENMFNFALDKLVEAKNARNASDWPLTKPCFSYDNGDYQKNKITVMGNPSLSEVQVIMIGIRNQSSEIKSGEIWVNELRLNQFNEDGGYAALANMVINLSDFGNVTVSGRTESSGFGSIEQNVMGRNIDDSYQVNVATGLELGRFFPEKAKIRIPFYYSHSRETVNPKYNPLDQDVLLDDALNAADKRSIRDSIKSASQDVTINRSISLSNVKVDIQSKKPQIYDPTNFSVGYTFTETKSYDPEIDYELTKNHRGTFNYNYSTTPKPYEPFANTKALNSKSLKLIKDFNVNYMPSYIAYANNINRYYYELQVKDLTGLNKLDPSFKQDFMWSRNFDLKYDFSRSLKFTLSTATNSRIDEPYVPVNKNLYPDDYQDWKDSVWSNVAKGGRPMAYQQLFTADYNVPLNKIPFLNWVTARGQYSSTYNWERGVTTSFVDDAGITQEFNLGNTAAEIRTWQIDSRLNLETLYKKSNYLAKVNDRFSGKKQKAPQSKKYTEKVSLKADAKKEIRHRLGSTDIVVTATDETGKAYLVKYKKVDQNTISISSKTDVNLDINIATVVREDNAANTVTDGLVRLLMMVRNISGTYKNTNSVILPGYQETTGFMGQRGGAPGYDFVFGFYDNEEYIKKAIQKGWLAYNDTISNPVAINQMTDLQLRASVEPVRSLKIELNAMRATSESRTTQYYDSKFDNAIPTFTGTFSMTQAAIGTSLWKIGSSGNFDSKAYNNFLAYRSTMASRITKEYEKANAELNDGYNINSSDVLIPAFLAAYTNRNPNKSTLDIFPSVLKMLPNWRITYNGLSNIEFIKKYFKSVNINHAYRCTYNVGSYTSLLGWRKMSDNSDSNYGYVTNILDSGGKDILSSQYDVATVTITESFSPFLGIEVATQNNISLKVEYKRARTLSLSLSSTQLIESFNNEWVFGAGYKIKNFNAILKIKQKQNAVSNDLTLRGDISIKDIKAIIRKIEEEYAQPTSGNKGLTLRITADYVFSEKVNIGLYYDRTTNTPFISSSYPTVSTDFGITFRFLLTR